MSNSETIHVAASSHSGYFARMWRYCLQIYPLPARVANAVALYIGFAILVCRINSLPVVLTSWWSLLAISNLFSLALLLRLMDELKDLDIDLRLFADRPVPSGQVSQADIRLSIALVSMLYLGTNLLALPTLWIALLCLAYTYLMFAYFFIPSILRRYLLLNLATHNPSVPLMLILLVVIISAQHKTPLSTLDWPRTSCAIAAFWSLLLGWELSRKIRSAEEEFEYVTYSQIFGRIPSSLITLAVQSVTAVAGVYFGYVLDFSAIFFLLLALAYAVIVFGHIRFILRPSPVTSKLKPYAEAYTMLAILAIIAEYVYGLAGGNP